MTFYALWYPTMKRDTRGTRGIRGRDSETARQSEVGYHNIVRQIAISRYPYILPSRPPIISYLR